jgi:hypothetical protein
MAKGQVAKEKLFAKIMEVFPNAFWEEQNKILRVPMDDGGTDVEIKVALTCAKDIIGGGSATEATSSESPVSSTVDATPAPTQEEVNDLKNLFSNWSF